MVNLEQQTDTVSVLFSGGSDSTLVAALMAEKYQVVHLHTYVHSCMFFEQKCEKSLKRLRDRFGHEKFTHRYVNINRLFRRIYLRDMVADFHKYGNYLLSCSCAACKIAMHIETIMFNLKHGIRHACDGSQRETGMLFPEQMAGVMSTLARFYASFGISYTNPVYDMERNDWRLYEMGLTPKRDSKNEHVYYSTQHSCLIGTLLYIYVLGFYVPFFGKQADETTSVKYVNDKLEILKKWVAEQSGKTELSAT